MHLGGVTAQPRPASGPSQQARNLAHRTSDERFAGSIKFLIRDRDSKFPGLFDAVLKDAGIEVVLSGVQMPRMKPRVAYCTSRGRCGVFWCLSWW